MLKRVLIGSSLLTTVLTAFWLDTTELWAAGRPAFALASLGVIASVGALFELLRMAGVRGAARVGWLALGLAWMVVLAGAVLPLERWMPGVFAARAEAVSLTDLLFTPWLLPRWALPAWLIVSSLLAGVLLLLHMRRGPGEHVVALVRQPLFCVAYAGGLAALMVPLLAGRVGIVVALVLVSKASDIGGYFAGKTLGRRKLAPVVSPNKTWEGLVGGVLLSALVGAFALPGLDATLPVVHAHAVALPAGALAGALLGVALALVAALSDLAESLVKRSLDVKDSGHWFGESGGFLDIADSLLLMAPAAVLGMALL